MTVETYDVGSMPFEGDYGRFLAEAEVTAKTYFNNKIIQGFVDKALSGLTIPNYPQYRDMNDMFLNMVDGVTKTAEGYDIEKTAAIKREKIHIPELEALKENLNFLYEQIGLDLKIKMCITGPHTLSWMFKHRDNEIFVTIAEFLAEIVRENIFKDKRGGVSLLSIDEPLLGIADDPRLDYGSAGRENLLKAWSKIFREATSRKVGTILHLHNTINDIYWDVEPLKIIESHVDDQFYSSKRTKKMIEQKDKFIKASVAITDFDKLISLKLAETLKRPPSSLIQEVAAVWNDLRKGRMSPENFLENPDVINHRFMKTLKWFGVERVKYAGPECGMRSFPTYQCALEYLLKISRALEDFEKKTK